MLSRIIIILLYFHCLQCFAQNGTLDHLDQLVNDYTTQLQQRGVDTICVYEHYSVGTASFTRADEEQCNYQYYMKPVFIIWIEDGKTYFTKKDNCYDYSSLEINPLDLWKFFLLYKNEIRREEVKNFEYEEIVEGKKEIYTIMTNHSTHRNFRIIFNGEIFEKKFDVFDLNERQPYSEERKVNLNFNHNTNLKSKILIEELKKLEQREENKLVRIKRT